MTREENIKNLLTELVEMIDNGSQRDLDRADEISNIILKTLEQEPKTEWISVSERLPKKYTYTLWCASSGCVESDYFNGEYWENAKKFCYDVIAWMPLPEPYKAESEG